MIDEPPEDYAGLHIHLLGGFSLVSDDTPITSVEWPRLQSLLTYLVLHRHSRQSRTHLASLLWPDSTETQAHTNLRTLLTRLRQALPNADTFVHSDRYGLQWQPQPLHASWTLDVLDFEQALVHAEQAQEPSAARRALEEAVALYHGDLLPGCYDEWILPERDRLQQAFLQALERLIELQEAERDYDAAISTARRLLGHDPLHEASYRHLMRLYLGSGESASALRIYYRCATILERELATEPSPATQEVYERLRQKSASSAPLATAPTPLVAAAPLVGRAHEWALLEEAWQHAVAGRPHFVVLSGEAGIGKTRLGAAAQIPLSAGRSVVDGSGTGGTRDPAGTARSSIPWSPDGVLAVPALQTSTGTRHPGSTPTPALAAGQSAVVRPGDARLAALSPAL